MRPNFAEIEKELAKPDLDPQRRKAIEDILAEYQQVLEQNPLEGFWPHSSPQRQFLEAATPIVAAFAGNRFGKTTALVCKCLIQHMPDDWLPRHLKPYRVATGSPVMGRMLVPSEKAFVEYTEPALKKWCPKSLLLGGSWEKAWSKQHWILRFSNGGQLSFYTYNADPATMVGAALDYVAYDEPPPESHRNECLVRLVDRDGREWFALTPVNMTGGGIGWLRQKIWKRKDDPNVTVVKASIHDNPLLSKDAVERVLAEYPEDERQAREHGDFIHFGGMVYVGGFERALVDPPTREMVRRWDVVVGIDPGLKNAAFTWHGFDQDNVACVFDELLLHEQTPKDYADAIRARNEQWGIKDPVYIIDPSARNRSLTNRESVQGELQRHGIFAFPGQNDVQAGVQNVRSRLATGYYLVSKACVKIRDEAEEYRMEDRPDGEFKIVKEKDHLLDSSRYACLSRPWVAPLPDPPSEPKRFYQQDFEPAYTGEDQNEYSPPLGAMS